MQYYNGFIVLDRKIIEWEWFTDSITLHVWLYCLLSANWKKGRFMGIEVPRGSFVSSYPKMAKNAHISIQQARTAIFHLKSTGEITVKSYPKFSLITVNNYNRYQDTNRQNNSQSTGNQQATNRQSTTIEQSNKVTRKQSNKKEKDIDTSDSVSEIVDSKTKHHYGENGNVLLTEAEYNKLHIDYPNADELINYLDLYIPDKAYKSKSHYSAIKRWVVDAVKKKESKLSNSEKFAQGKRAF